MNYQEIQQELQKGLKTFRVFEHAEKAVAALVGLEQNRGELEAAVAALRSDLAAARADLAKAQEQAATIVADSRAKADDIVDRAAKKATATLAAAEAKAAEREAAGQAQFEHATLHAQAQASIAKEITEKIEAKTRELAALEAKTAEAREQVAKVLGGLTLDVHKSTIGMGDNNG